MHELKIHTDDRRRFVNGIFPTEGDVNVVTLQPGVTIAWHRHQKQTDYLYCIKGTVKVGVLRYSDEMWHEGNDVDWETLTEWDSQTLEIPPNRWHGYRNLGPDRAIIIGYTSQHYDPLDEERRSISEMGIDWETQER